MRKSSHPCFKLGLGLILLAGSIAVNASEKVKVCHISSSIGHVLPRANDFKNEWKGFEFAIAKYPQLEFLIHHSASKTGVLDGVRWADEQKCMVVVGLVTSQDALIAAPELKEKNIFGVSSTATTIRIKPWSSHLRSLAVSTESYVMDLKNKIGDKRIVVVGKSGSLFSQGFKDVVTKHFAHVSYVDSINESSKKILLQSEIVFFALYPIEALDWVDLPEIKEKIVLGNQSWNEVQVFNELPKTDFLWKKIKILSPLDIKNKKAKSYAASFYHRYKLMPDHDSFYDSEVIDYIATCIPRKGAIKKEAIYNCLRNKNQFHGTIGLYRFHYHDTHPTIDQNLTSLSDLPGKRL